LDPILCWFRFWHFTSGLVGLATIAANIYVIVTVDGDILDYRDIIMRGYAVLFGIVIVLVELDWRCVMKKFKIFEHWLVRGLFYFFVGFITIRGGITFQQPEDIIGLVQIAVGAIYALMGLFCIKSIKTQRLAYYAEKSSRSRIGSEPTAYVSV
jgi:hypothetical protein